MRAIDLLKQEGYKLTKGKYYSPDYYKGKRGIDKDKALNRIAKDYGYKDYQSYQRATRGREYKQFKRWYERVQGTDKGFERLFGKAKKSNFRAKSSGLVDLLRATTFQTGSDGTWYHGSGWQQYGWGKYH